MQKLNLLEMSNIIGEISTDTQCILIVVKISDKVISVIIIF